MSVLPEHSDNEGDICPWSSIFTISIGANRKVVFRNTKDNVETIVYCPNRSMYQMTRHSQDFYQHQLKPEPEQEDTIRYSLTFRAVQGVYTGHFTTPRSLSGTLTLARFSSGMVKVKLARQHLVSGASCPRCQT